MLNRSRKIFYIGSVSNPYKETLLGGEIVTIQQACTLRNWGYSTFVVTGLGRLESLRTRRQRDSLFIHRSQFERLIEPDTDVVVVPGRHLSELNSTPGRNKVLFSQGAYITLAALNFRPGTENPWQNPSLKGIFCVSKGNADLIQAIAGNRSVSVIPPHIRCDCDPATGDGKEILVAFPSLNRPEKNPLDTKAVLHLICARLRMSKPGLLRQLQFLELSGLSHQDLLAILKKASVLLFLGNNEGLPLLVLEAMKHHVITVGFNRKPLSDLLHKNCTFEIGELERIADTAVDVLENPRNWDAIRSWGRAKADTYTEDAHLKSLREAWSGVEDAIVGH